MNATLRRGCLVLLMLAALGSVGVDGAAPATASPICAEAGYETLVGMGTLTPPCVPYGSSTTCNYQDVGVAPWFDVTTTVCVPRP